MNHYTTVRPSSGNFLVLLLKLAPWTAKRRTSVSPEGKGEAKGSVKWVLAWKGAGPGFYLMTSECRLQQLSYLRSTRGAPNNFIAPQLKNSAREISEIQVQPCSGGREELKLRFVASWPNALTT